MKKKGNGKVKINFCYEAENLTNNKTGLQPIIIVLVGLLVIVSLRENVKLAKDLYLQLKETVLHFIGMLQP